MRLISDTLLAAQRQVSARPYVRAVFSDSHGDTARLHFQRHYTGAESEYYTAAAVAADGSLVRARIDSATSVLYTQRVANPGPSSSFSAWTSQGTVSASGAVALCAGATHVSLFYVDADTMTVRMKQSSDNGASYGGATTVATAASAVKYLAAAEGTGASAGQIVLFWTVGAAVWRSRYVAGAWGSPGNWPHSVASITGLACAYFADFSLIVCGTESGTTDAKVWTSHYGDGLALPANTWGALLELTTANNGSGVSFHAPALARLDDWRLFFVEKYTGTQAYARLQWSVMAGHVLFDASAWQEPGAFDYTGDYGVAVATGGTTLWLAAAAGVWTGAFADPPALDVSADVLDAQVSINETHGEARLVLSNDAVSGQTGRYAGYGSGPLATLQRGARLDLWPGYYTTAGPEALDGDAFWVESIEQTTGAEARLIVHARDGWWLLERWRARRQFAWQAGSTTIAEILTYVCTRAGLSIAIIDGSTAIHTLTPAFTIGAGQSARTAVLRLAAMMPDRIFLRGSVLCTRQVTSGDATDYEYGTSHAISSARYIDAGPTVNRARVLGTGVFNEGFDFAEIQASGERIAQVSDRNLTTAVQTADRAAETLRAAALAARRDEARLASVNAAQELLDVVEVTDPQVALSSAKRRVRGIAWRYTGHGPSPRYEMTLTLGEP